MKNTENDDFSTQTAFTNAYSSPSTGSLESIMGNTNSENSSPTPPPSHDERNVSRYMDNLRYAWCFNNKAEMPTNNRSHKITPSLDVFCTDRLCSRRRTKTPENRLKDDEVFCGLGGLTIASLVLIGTAEFFILITAAYAAYYCFQHSGNWDIGGVIFGLTLAHTFFAAIFAYGIFKKRFKFLLPLTFLSFLIVVAGCGAFLVALFTSFGADEKFSDTELVAYITFCFLLGVIICHQLALFIISIKLFFIMKSI